MLEKISILAAEHRRHGNFIPSFRRVLHAPSTIALLPAAIDTSNQNYRAPVLGGSSQKSSYSEKNPEISKRWGKCGRAEEVNFREVMEYLSSLSEADREQALNEAMEDAVRYCCEQQRCPEDCKEIDRLSRIAGSSGLDKRQRLRRSQTIGGVASQGGANKYKVMGGGGKQGKRHGMSSGASSRRTSLNRGASRGGAERAAEQTILQMPAPNMPQD